MKEIFLTLVYLNLKMHLIQKTKKSFHEAMNVNLKRWKAKKKKTQKNKLTKKQKTQQVELVKSESKNKRNF